MTDSKPKTFGFVFPMASGHINPSFPIARSLVNAGHKVHYLCREQMRAPIEDTGATFHSEVEIETELYEGRAPSLIGCHETLVEEYGLQADPVLLGYMKLKVVQQELMLPGLIRWLEDTNIDAICYCPLMTSEASHAANFLGIPCVALLTTSGPGASPRSIQDMLKLMHLTAESLCKEIEGCELHRSAVDRVNSKYGLSIGYTDTLRPLGQMSDLKGVNRVLVTTIDELMDPLDPDINDYYQKNGIKFEGLGALLDQEGAQRSGGHKYMDDQVKRQRSGSDLLSNQPLTEGEVLDRVEDANKKKRPVVFLSMGTVLTGDHPQAGWHGRFNDRGLTGREHCQAAWAGIFDALGTTGADDGPLLVLATGPQPDPLEGVDCPANMIWAPVVPQVDLLKKKISLFLTHGGQNSFMESLSHGVPVVVCPGFGDQPINATKAEAIGVGLKVLKPDPDPGAEAEAIAQFRADVAKAADQVFSADPDTFLKKAESFKQKLAQAGGVKRAMEVMLSAAELRKASPQERQVPAGGG